MEVQNQENRGKFYFSCLIKGWNFFLLTDVQGMTKAFSALVMDILNRISPYKQRTRDIFVCKT